MQRTTRNITPVYLALLCLAGLISSCNVQKYIPEDQYLLKDAQLTIQAADSVATAAIRAAGNELLSQRVSPRWRVWWHYREKFPLRWLGERIGRAPTFYSEQAAELNRKLLENRAQNQGHFYNLATYEKDTLPKQQALRLRYDLRISAAYTIDTLGYYFPDSSLSRRIANLREKSLVEVGGPYRLSALKAERERLAQALRDQGYFYFDGNDLEFLADTIGNDQGVQLLLRLKPNLSARKTTPQGISEISVVTSRGKESNTKQVTDYEGLRLSCDPCPLRPEILAQAIAFEPGAYYQPVWHERTIERLASFNTFRYISVNYSPDTLADSLLRVQVLLTPSLRRSISGEIGAAYNSGRYFGPELSVQYQNRNLFRGAELLTIRGDITYNFFLGPESESRIPRSGIYNLESTLQIPRFFLPGIRSMLPSLREAGTYITLGAKREGLTLSLERFADEIAENELLSLQEYLEEDGSAREPVDLWQFSLDYGYNWKRKPSITHRLTLTRIRYQNPRVRTEELLSLSRSLGFTQGLTGLGRLDRMFLIGPSYDWRYDSRLSNRPEQRASRHQYLFELELGLGFNQVLPVGSNERQLEREQSNYIRPVADLRHYWRLNSAFTLASRLHVGGALPFTKRAIVPYFDLFTVGGPNSLRAFLPREIGPGITVPIDNAPNLLGINGYGNVMAEASTEIRWQINELLQIAGFVDAGNVWLYKTEVEPTPGDFDFSRFRQELAADAGGGIRLDLSFLVLRLDLAWPIRIPYEVDPESPPDKGPRLVLGFGQAF